MSDKQEDIERLIASWARGEGLSEHLKLEVAHSVHCRHDHGEILSLEPKAPVPGCGCPACLTLAAGGDWYDADLAVEVVWMLADLAPEDRVDAVISITDERERLGIPVTWPRPQLLAIAASRVPGAYRDDGISVSRGYRESLPVEQARSTPLARIANRLRLGDPVRRGDEIAVLCPLHDDTTPSLYLNEQEGVWYCHVCGEGGDGIGLVQRARGLDFVAAVRWIVS